MRVKNITQSELSKAINTVNALHGYRIIFNRYPEKIGNYLHFTIRSEKSGIPGARISPSGRNLVSSSWHAHGYLFEELLNINNNAVIITASNRIDSDGGNWEDRNIGSHFQPAYFSELSIL